MQSPLETYLTHVNCLECGQNTDFYPGLDLCPACGGVWLDARYDYARVAPVWQAGLQSRSGGLWRYRELLPLLKPGQAITMGEGNSPLIKAIKMERRLSHPAIFIKDERQSPTSSFKDRQAAVAVSAMVEAGIKECVLASTGNAAAAYAAYCARADIKLWIFLTSLVPSAKMREAALYGAEVIKVTGTYDQAKKVAADFAARRGVHLDKGAKAIPGKESMKTVAFEIAEGLASLPLRSGSNLKWQAPDWYIQAVSGGIGPIGVQKGFEELYEMGLIDRVPKIGVVQVAGCAPMARAFAARQPTAEPVVPETRITVLSTGAPGLGYELLYQANQRYGGHMLSVSDDEAFAALRLLAKTEGYSVEPATAVAFAGLEKLIAETIIRSDECVVVNCSGHTFPVETHIINDENVLDFRLSDSLAAAAGAPLDGLGPALQRLDEQVTTIVIVDDNPLDSQLIRRILQARKPYRIFETNDAKEGLAIIKARRPDLVVSDLAMPEMDGFALLEALKRDPITAGIPVIIVSAKDLSPEDEQRLAGRTASIWLKGAFSTQDLAQHVVETLSNTEKLEDTTNPNVSRERKMPQPISAKPAAEPPVQKKRVVLIEDNPVDARLISRILRLRYELEVRQVQTGEEAIEVIAQERPHLVILDLVMPGKSGFQILEDLRQDPKLDTIPVVVITSKDLSPVERKRLVASGVDSLWQKDRLDRGKLIAHVESQLGGN